MSDAKVLLDAAILNVAKVCGEDRRYPMGSARVAVSGDAVTVEATDGRMFLRATGQLAEKGSLAVAPFLLRSGDVATLLKGAMKIGRRKILVIDAKRTNANGSAHVSSGPSEWTMPKTPGTFPDLDLCVPVKSLEAPAVFRFDATLLRDLLAAMIATAGSDGGRVLVDFHAPSVPNSPAAFKGQGDQGGPAMLGVLQGIHVAKKSV